MSASPHLDRGQGPVVVLVHGVGVGPGSFDQVADQLAGASRVIVVERPTGPGGAAAALDDQADRLVDQLAGLDALGGRLVGVSGGATLALLVAMRHPDAVTSLVVHEPLVGSHAPGLHARFRAAALQAASGTEGAMAVVAAVLGDRTWAALGVDGRRAAWAQAARWQGEIAAFAGFDPSAGDLEGLRALPMLVTVGARSDDERRVAAGVLQRLAAADVAEVPDAGNAVQLDAPDAFALLLRSWQPVLSGGAR